MIIFKKLNYKINYKLWLALTLSFSWVIVAFGQPAWSASLSLIASICGFSCFWIGLNLFSQSKSRFWISLLWFMAVEAVHLSWMTATEYQGLYIYGVYLFILVMEGLQFALFTFFIKPKEKLSFVKIGFLAALWVVMEWSRLFFICGFPFNPVGLSLTASLLGLQNASLAGVYGLSFLVMLGNLIAYRFFIDMTHKKYLFSWILVVFLPYLYGGVHLHYHQKQILRSQHNPPIRALLVQTALSPPQKTGFGGFHHMYAPIDQWALIYQYIADRHLSEVDIIALPENAIPLASNDPYFNIEMVRAMVKHYFNEDGLRAMPELERGIEFVDNIFLSQTLANLFKAQVVIGLEHIEKTSKNFVLANASAYCFTPHSAVQFYHKQILIPLVEYIPFEWCKKLAKRYGIQGWYERGTEAVVFNGRFKISPSICMEEMYSFIVHQGRKIGAEIFLNISNDGWYPSSKLPRQHFNHGAIRGVENGVPVLRACNTGVTVALDSVGQVVRSFGGLKKEAERERGALYVEVPAYHYATLYSYLGDRFILSLSVLLILNFILNALIAFKLKGDSLTKPVRESSINN